MWWLISLVGCDSGAPAPSAPAAGGPGLRVLFQTRGEGEIEPCG
jgi:hypothetical protein